MLLWLENYCGGFVTQLFSSHLKVFRKGAEYSQNNCRPRPLPSLECLCSLITILTPLMTLTPPFGNANVSKERKENVSTTLPSIFIWFSSELLWIEEEILFTKIG
jgi:hypothetical protein